jgi:hypothetical protein
LATLMDGAHSARARLATAKGLGARANATEGSMEVVRFLKARVDARPTEAETFDTPLGSIWGWLRSDVILAFQSELISAADLLTEFGEDFALSVAHNVGSRGRGEVGKAFRSNLAKEFLTELKADPGAVPLENLRLKLSLVFHTLGAPDLVAIFDSVAKDDGGKKFAEITAAMTRKEGWSGTDGIRYELAFEKEIWPTIFSPAVRAELVSGLPASPDLESIDDEDTSDKNSAEFAYSWARRIERQAAEVSDFQAGGLAS